MATAGLPIVVGRRYDSGRAIDVGMGYGWVPSVGARLSYTTYLYQAPSTYRTEADVAMPEGSSYRYVENPDATTYVAPDARKDVLIKNVDGSWDLTLERTRSGYHFDPTGALTAMHDDYGNTLSVTYLDGRIYRISDTAGSGRYIEVSYGADGRINIISDSAGRQVQYGYTNGNLTSVIDAANRTTTYGYDAGRFVPVLSRVTDNWSRVVMTVSYEPASGKVSTYTDHGETYTFTYAYQSVLTRTAKADSAGNRWRYDFNAIGLITSRGLEGTPLARTDFYPDGSVQQQTDEVGVKTFYAPYNANGTPTSIIRDYQGPQAVRFDYAYDPAYPEKVTSVTPLTPTGSPNPDWQGWQYEYYQAADPAPGALRYVKRVKSDGSLETLTSYVYNSRGQVTSQTSATGGVTDYGYDSQTNLTSVTSPANNNAGTRPMTVYVPDPLGRNQSVTDPLGHTTTYVYDNLDRVTSVTLPKPSPGSPLDFTTVSTYDNFDSASGLVYTQLTDPNGRVSRQFYDQFGRLVKTTDAQSLETRYGYTRDVLTSITDANGNVTAYGYDARRRLRATTFPDSAVERYDYWEDGPLKVKTDRKNQTITYNYDDHKRVQSKIYASGSITYAYTGQKLTSVVDTSVSPETHTFGYDTSYRVQTNGQATRGTLTYGYNPDDTVASYAVASGPTATYAYYPDGSLKTIDWSLVSGQFQYTYRLNGQYDSIRMPSGQHRDFGYDDQGRLLQLANLHPSAGNLATYAYGYDHDYGTGTDTVLGQRTSLTATVPSQGLSGALTTYRYDPLYQLTRVDYPNVAPFSGEVHSWTYDPTGNRLTNTVNASTLTYTYQSVAGHVWQRLLNDGVNAYTYDPNGSTGTKTGPGGNFTFGWDRENRMSGITGSETAMYRYDYQGRRSGKTVGTATAYLYDGLNLIGESGGSSAGYLFGPGFDEPLAMSRGGQLYYYATDALGSVAASADSGGSVQNSYLYDAWGQTRTQTGSIANPFAYTARETGEAASIFYRARFYQPSLGRFLSEDALRRPVSLFSYADNRPTSYTDPLGLQAMSIQPIQPAPWWPLPFPGPTPDSFYWYGNWGGPGWSGGQWTPGGAGDLRPGGGRPPIDPQDACYQMHDYCYAGCRRRLLPCPTQYCPCTRGCDRDLAECLRRARPTRAGVFQQGAAETYFDWNSRRTCD